MFFWNSLAFFMIQQMLGIWFLVLLPFLNPVCTWKFLVHILLKPSLKDLNIILIACEMSATVQEFEHFLALSFFVTGMKIDLFQSCGYCWVFQISWYIECSILIASYFSIWNSSAGIPSPPLAFFVVMLPKTHLTSHSRMSGSRWVITPLSLSGSWRYFCIVLLCILANS